MGSRWEVQDKVKEILVSEIGGLIKANYGWEKMGTLFVGDCSLCDVWEILENHFEYGYPSFEANNIDEYLWLIFSKDQENFYIVVEYKSKSKIISIFKFYR